MSMELSLEGSSVSVDVSYGYWNEFANWVAEVRPKATSILHKSPYEGGWTPEKIDKLTPTWQRSQSLLRDVNVLQEADGSDEHEWLLGELRSRAEASVERGRKVTVS